MKKSILLLILSVTVGSGMGQTLKTYSGLYEGGKATYTYYEDENGERIKQGKFTYNKTQSGVGVGVGMIGGNNRILIHNMLQETTIKVKRTVNGFINIR